MQVNILRQFSCEILLKVYKKVILQFLLQDSCKIFYILQEKCLRDLHSYFLQDGFYWDSNLWKQLASFLYKGNYGTTQFKLD